MKKVAPPYEIQNTKVRRYEGIIRRYEGTKVLRRYLRNFFKSHKCWNQFIPRDNSFRCGPRVYMWMFSLVFFWIPHLWAISKPEARRDLHRATRLSCTSGVCAGPRRTSMVSTRWKSFLRLLSSWRYSEFQSGAFYFCVNFYGIWNIPYDYHTNKEDLSLPAN